MTRTSLALPALALLAGVLLVAPARPASADVVRLRTGEAIKGRVIVERSNEQVLVIEDYLSGATREIAWQAVDPTDAEKLQTGKLEFLDPDHGSGSVAIPGERITVKQTVGTAELRGIVELEGPNSITVRTQSGKIEITKDRIVSREKEDIDASDVYSADELYELKLKEVDPQDSRGWMRVAQYAERVGAYRQAKDAYETIALDETYLNRTMAQQKVVTLTALLKDQEALEALRFLRVQLSSGQFQKVREGLAAFAEKHPEAGEAVKKKVEELTARFTAERTTFMSKKAGDNFVKKAQKLIADKVKPKDAVMSDVQAWTRKELPEEAFAELTKLLQTYDLAVTPEETKTFWEGRPKKPNVWRKASYGSGSFIIEPAKIKPPTGGGGGGGRPPPRPGGGPAPPIKIPPPPHRAGWGDTPLSERAEWILAYFVENSGLFEVAPKRDKSACALCLGEGLIRKVLSGGGQLVYLCTRCGGTQYDLTVKYR